MLVTADQTNSGKFWLRSEMDSECFNVANPNLDYQAKAVVRYTMQPSAFDLELCTPSGAKRNIF